MSLRSSCLLVLLVAAACGQSGRNAQQPRVVSPGDSGKPPSDAVILFDGTDLSGWTTGDGQIARCTASDGVMSCRTGAGDIYSTEKFGSAQIHIEFSIPSMPKQTGQMRGNSGVYIHGCFEVQILDSYENQTYPDGSCGAVYGISAPLVNASRPPEQWQTYDIVFRSPRCDASGVVSHPGLVTILHNGVLIQDHVAIGKPGSGCKNKNICEPGPLMLQDHSGFPGAPDTTMKFRNIWIRKLD